jgi:hypothetical protein
MIVILPPACGGLEGVDFFCESKPQACGLKGYGRLYVHACSQGETLGSIPRIDPSPTLRASGEGAKIVSDTAALLVCRQKTQFHRISS